MTGVAGVFDNFQGLPLTPPGVEVLLFPVVHNHLLSLGYVKG